MREISKHNLNADGKIFMEVRFGDWFYWGIIERKNPRIIHRIFDHDVSIEIKKQEQIYLSPKAICFHLGRLPYLCPSTEGEL